ncbi:Centrosomal protein of 70 kDa-like [Oopsacas minuta]|uniref:Centrosomal protein of 70 kDa-like n=1 Tax=Oopsacas minuta TaxID=111878 RepID=A0AAV7JUP7_9METZ|nr:Centrosomal protein of 70 kDa-like [Oopsacas minuta]
MSTSLSAGESTEALTDPPPSSGTLSPTLRLENLLKKCKDTLDTHLANQSDLSINDYFPLAPIENEGSDFRSASREYRNISWKDINQELLIRGLPSISIPLEVEDGRLIPGPNFQDVGFIITKLLQEISEQKSQLSVNEETFTKMTYNMEQHNHEVIQLQELLTTKDKIIGQLNDRCSLLDANCNQLKSELNSPHLREIEDILEEGKLSKEGLINAQQRVKRLECELMTLKSNQFDVVMHETNPFLQPGLHSRTFDKEDNYQMADSGEIKIDNSNELLQQIGSFIRLLCNEVGVDTIAELYTSIRSIKESKQNAESMAIPVFEECVQLMNNSSLPPKLRPQSYDKITLNGFVELVKVWVEEMCGIRHLQNVIRQLSSYAVETCYSGKERYFLLDSTDYSDEWSIIEMSEFIQSVFLNSTNEKLLSFDVLKGLFTHFANLFKVHEPVNILTLMSDIQRRFEEMENVLRACKIAIGLKENSSNSSLTKSIQNMSLKDNNDNLPISTFDHLELLERVKFYEQFFFHFEWIIAKLFKLLSIDKLSEVIPKIELLTQSKN